MKYLLALLFTSFVSTSLAQTIINDKNAEVRNVGEFSGIRVSGGIDVYLSQSDEYALAVSASNQKMKDDIETKIVDGVLVISYNSRHLNINEKRYLRAYISFKTLQSIEGSGACNINIQETFTSKVLRLTLSSACDLKGKIAIDDMDAKLSGASTAKITGKINNLKLEASGASDLKNYGLHVENLIATLSGASDVRIFISNSLTVKASGASSLNYSGDPSKVDINASGASSVKQRK